MAKTNKIFVANVLDAQKQRMFSLGKATSSKCSYSLGHLIAFLHTFPSYCFLSDVQLYYSIEERKYNYRRLSGWRKRIRYAVVALVIAYGANFSWPWIFSKSVRGRLGGVAFTFWNIGIYVSVRVLTLNDVDQVLRTIECLEFIQHLNPLLKTSLNSSKHHNIYRVINWTIFASWLSWSCFGFLAADLNLLKIKDGDIFLHIAKSVHGFLHVEMPNVPDSFSLPGYSILLTFVVAGVDLFLEMHAYMIDTIALVYTGVFYAAVNIACAAVTNIAARAHATLEDLNEILIVFNRLQALSESIKRSVGPVFASLCLAYLPYYCYSFQNVFDAKLSSTGTAIAQGIVGASVMAIFLCVSAEAHDKISQLASLLTTVLQKVEFQSTDARIDCNSRVHVVLHNVRCGEFGIRSNFFTVTYSLVGALIGTVLTYSVIVFQIKNDSLAGGKIS